MSRFDYIRYDIDAQNVQNQLKEKFEDLEALVQSSLENGREKSLVMTKLEEAYMWVGKSIRNMQINRLGPQPDVSERSSR